MAFIDKEKLRNKAVAETVSEHPLLKKRPMSAAERTAYLQGCVLAALVDDAQVSSEEHRLIRTIGLSLNFADNEIEDTFNVVAGLRSEDDKLSLVDDIVSLLKVEPIRSYFVDDFKRVIESGDSKDGDAIEIFDLIGQRLYEDAAWQKNMSLAKAKIDADKEKRMMEKELVQTVENEMGWPADYDKNSIFDLMEQHGFKEHQVSLLLSLLLPYAQGAYEAVKKEINRMEYSVDHDRHRINLSKNDNALRFMNYIKCMSDCASYSPCHAIVRSGKSLDDFMWGDDDDYTLKTGRRNDPFFVSLECVDYSHRKRGAREEAIKELLRLYKSLLDEFENMSKF